MYITYETAEYFSLNDQKVPNDLPKPDFMPSKLVCISDMKAVNGSQVNEGYCALSYTWNQSGNILIDETTGKYKRIDDGKHKIIRKDGNYEYVKFEGVIQYICQQFNIKYIWYDQLCINQDNKKEKQHEIRNMHHIYENAYCTVAFIPDYSYTNYLNAEKQEYFKRLWTLEEAIKSTRLLFVGRDRHIYGEHTYSEINHLTKSSSELNVSQILYHAHQRTSTKDHDRVFALIHLFPEFMDEINIDYDQPFEDLMIQFYGLLAKKDISILFFGKKRFCESTIKKYKFLPSWTGVNGEHVTHDITTSFQNYDIIEKTMHVATTFVTNNQSIYDDNLTIREEDIPPTPDYINDGDKHDYHLCILVQLSKTNETKIIFLDNGIFADDYSAQLQRLSRFMEIKKENLWWCNRESDDYRMAAWIDFGYLPDSLDDTSGKYVILSEVLFKSNEYNRYYYPVIKKQGGDYYKAIGCCEIESNKDFFSDCNLPKQTFLIQ